MTFDLRAILIFVVAALVYNLLPSRWRGCALLAGSAAAVYILQPSLPIRFSDFILPTVTLCITAAAWWFTRAPGQTFSRDDRFALGLLVAVILGLSLMRYVDAAYRLTPSRPPETIAVAAWLAVLGGIIWLWGRTPPVPEGEAPPSRNRLLVALILLIIVLFICLKAEPLARGISGVWRGLTGQDASIASALDFNWLGFSYVAFRLIHTLRDRMTGLLPELSLREYITYVIFFPAFTSGPIDRAERFVEDYRDQTQRPLQNPAIILEAGTRIFSGLLKKFVIADLLAGGASLNAANAAGAHSTLGLWLLLYGYALRLFFDFSGYTDIAIGIGILFGIRLPENFNRPYLKTNITAFWQSWHMTLSSWVRAYVFSPLSRWLLKRQPRPSPMLIVLITQCTTMIVIGLWHGMTVNFLIWGLWHGLALWIHKQWSDRTRTWYREMPPARKRLWTVFTWALTFHYVVLGWVWFALPDVNSSLRVFRQLFGI